MPILLVFALVAACLPVDWPRPPFEPEREVALALTGGAVSLVLLVAFALRTWVVRALRRDPSRRYEVARAYNRWRRALFYVNVGTVAACVLGFGWGWLVTKRELLVDFNGVDQLAPFAELAVPLPYFVVLFGCWVIYYDAERALHRALHAGGRPFGSRAGYVLHNLRQFALLVMLPVAFVVAQQTLGRFAPETTRSALFKAASLAVMPCVILLLPLVLKPLLGLKSMPAGPLRDRFEALAARLDFRYADFLLWHTHGTAANAFITGLLPRVRYVVFTDRILEDMPADELEAVFGHEVGHAKHGHIWLYAAFLMLSLAVLAALGLLLEKRLNAATGDDWVRLRTWLDSFKTWLLLPPLGLVVGYLFVVFGTLSRRCERQADLYGSKAVSCADPACAGHDANTAYAPGARCLCPTGLYTFARALDRVRELNGMEYDAGGRSLRHLLRAAWGWVRAWQHGPLSRRIAYLRNLATRMADEPRFQSRLFAFKCVLMLSLAAALVALGEAVGWKDLFDAL